MKKLILGLLIFTALSMSFGCGSSEEKQDEQKYDLTNTYFIRSDRQHSIYFINQNQLLKTYWKNSTETYTDNHEYTINGDTLTIIWADKENPEDKYEKFIIYNNEVLMYYFTDEEYKDKKDKVGRLYFKSNLEPLGGPYR